MINIFELGGFFIGRWVLSIQDGLLIYPARIHSGSGANSQF